MAAALDVPESGSRPLADSLKDFLYEKRLLLFDNFEQVVDAAPLVAELLAAPDLRAITTSRALLQLYGEHEFTAPPLDEPPTNDEAAKETRRQGADRSPGLPVSSVVGQYAAVALFVERALPIRRSL